MPHHELHAARNVTQIFVLKLVEIFCGQPTGFLVTCLTKSLNLWTCPLALWLPPRHLYRIACTEQEAGTLAFQLYAGSKGSLNQDEALDALRAMGCAPKRSEVSGMHINQSLGWNFLHPVLYAHSIFYMLITYYPMQLGRAAVRHEPT